MNEKGFAKVPGMQEYGVELVDIDILECLTFPWQLRYVQTKIYRPFSSNHSSNQRPFSKKTKILQPVLIFTFRIVQKIAMENLNKKWQEFIQADTASFYDQFDLEISSGAFSFL